MSWRPPENGSENFRRIWDAIYLLRASHNNVATQMATLPPVPTFEEIRTQLQLGGSAPINVLGLQGSGAVLQGTHAQRLASFGPTAYPGALFYETDRLSLYASNGSFWTLVAGRFNVAQANIASLGLGAGDNGMLVYVTDFAHLLQWNGTAFGYADGDMPGRIQGFLVDPPNNNGWAFCDGSNTTYLQANGTVSGNVTLPNFSGAAFAYLGWGNNANATFLATGPANATGNLLELRPWFRR